MQAPRPRKPDDARPDRGRRDDARSGDPAASGEERGARGGDGSPEPLRENVELKARLHDPEAAARTCARLGASDCGAEEQVDTYFTLGRQRLKLRETSSGGSWLISYARPDRPDVRKSQYRLRAIPNPGAIKATLVRQWGVKCVVRKTRRLWMWQGRVRIHLDRVEGLGDFLEFEAVLSPDRPDYDAESAALDVERLRHDFGLTSRDLIATSYSTLAVEGQGAPAGT